MKTPSMAYLICTNPRSGSWLLAEGLRATGVAGRPEEYANDLLRPLYLRDFDLTPPVAPEVLLDRMIEAGTTDNGVFGAKVHRMQWQAFLSLLRAAVGDPDADELDAITTVFPDLVLVHHDRQDRTGQALSWYRALATDNWWHVDGVRDIRCEAGSRNDGRAEALAAWPRAAAMCAGAPARKPTQPVVNLMADACVDGPVHDIQR